MSLWQEDVADALLGLLGPKLAAATAPIAREMFFNAQLLWLTSTGEITWDPNAPLDRIEQDPWSPGEEVLFVACQDPDGDDRCTGDDNCPEVANVSQRDCDGDGLGDACDPTLCVTDLGWESAISTPFSPPFVSEVNSALRLTLRTSGGTNLGQRETRRVEAYWCDCQNYWSDESCQEWRCLQYGENNQGDFGPFTGWYPTTWTESSLVWPECVADQSCPPIPDVPFVRCGDGSAGSASCADTRRQVVWQWRYQQFPPDGEGVAGPGEKRLKLRARPVDNDPPDPAQPPMADTHYTYTPVQRIVHEVSTVDVEPDVLLPHVNPQNPHEFGWVETYIQDPREWFPWMYGAELVGAVSRGPDESVEPGLLYVDTQSGALLRLDELAAADPLAGGPQAVGFASAVLQSGDQAVRLLFGGHNPDGSLSDELWAGQAGGRVTWSQVDARAAAPELTEVALGGMPQEINVNPLVIAAEQRLAYVSNRDLDVLNVVDLDSGMEVAQIGGFVEPNGLALRAAAGELWVADSGRNALVVVDLDTWGVKAELELGRYSPTLVVLDPWGRLAFVRARYQEGSSWRWAILQVHTLGPQVLQVVPYAYHDLLTRDALAVSVDGQRLFVARDNYERIDVYEARSMELLESVDIDRAATGIALTDLGRTMVVTNLLDDSVMLLDTESWENKGVIEGIPTPAGLDIDAGGRLAVVTNLGVTTAPDSVTVIDLEAGAVAFSLPVGDRPTTVKLADGGREAWVVNARSGTLTAVRRLALHYGTPAARTGAVLVAAPDGGAVHLFGGQTATGASAEVWTLDASDWTWSQVSGEEPALAGGLSDGAVAHDWQTGDVFVFGGETATGLSAGLVHFDTAAGSFATLDPLTGRYLNKRVKFHRRHSPPRIGSCPVARSDTGLAFPGRAAAPEARRDGALTYLPGRRALYLFGGQAQDGLRGDAWLFSLAERTWHPLEADCASGLCPAPRAGAAALPLSDGQRVLVFGGRTGVPGEGLRSWIQDLSTGAWTPAEQPTAEAGDLEGGLKRIDYLGKRLERKVGESFDRSALVAEAERGPERSVRWVGQVRVVEGGEYTWRIRSRGGARLFVDGKPVALVGGQANALGRCSRLDAETREIPLASGWHDLVVDWTICRQGGQIEVEVVRGPDGPGPIPPERLRYRSAGGLVRKGYFPMFWWLAETGEDFDRTPADDDWGAGLPEVLGVRWPNHFAVGWEGFVRVEVAGEYRFVAETDDGARLRVGGQRLIDDLWGRAAVRRSAPVWLDAGWHALEFLVVERGGSARARLRFDESCPELGGQVLQAERCAVRFEPAER